MGSPLNIPVCGSVWAGCRGLLPPALECKLSTFGSPAHTCWAFTFRDVPVVWFSFLPILPQEIAVKEEFKMWLSD